MPNIHPLALVEPGAKLAADVIVGPFAYVGPHVTLGPGCVLHHHAQIEGHTTAGANNTFFPNCLIGAVSQDLKYKGGDCRVTIGSDNVFRENATVHIGTEVGAGETRIGDHNLIMVGAHIAHDCILHNHIILANNVLLAGHVLVEDHCVLSGAVASHHFVTIGRHAFIGGISAVTRDVPPFMVFDGMPAIVRGINKTGLKRRGFDDSRIDALRCAYRLLFKDTTPFAAGAAELEQLYPDQPDIRFLLQFMRASLSGKFGRARENLRGKSTLASDDEDAPPPHVSGN
ncbi:MAG TPA: acyl-ACP--UDP-N-acetylglucosamine O-acyltransferase [Phycisphaerae bacterium]|nr:acyl-ACP--UDP-N-acetylglucosamine O-acyltransferase [Phycisphaerae bacterium]